MCYPCYPLFRMKKIKALITKCYSTLIFYQPMQNNIGDIPGRKRSLSGMEFSVPEQSKMKPVPSRMHYTIYVCYLDTSTSSGRINAKETSLAL